MPTLRRSLRPTPIAWLLLAAPVAPAALAACGGTAGSPETVHDGGGDAVLIIHLDAGKQEDSGGSEPHFDAPAPAEAAVDAGIDAPALTVVPLVSCVPSEYTAAVTLGGTQTFQMAIDTGSTTLGVASTSCASCGVSPEYTPASTATDQHKMGDSQYGTGSWTGEIYEDGVRVGTSRVAPDTFVSIDTQSQFFQPGVQCGSAAGPQGILGLGPAGSALPNTEGFFDALVANENVPNLFATKLCDTDGTLWLGGFDAAATTAAPQYTPINPGISQYYYAVTLSSITLAGVSVPVAAGQYTDSIVDTGTSVFILPTAAFTTITNLIGANPVFDQLWGLAGPVVPDAGSGDAGTMADGGVSLDGGASVDSGMTPVDATPAPVGPSAASAWFSSPNNHVQLTQTKAELDAMLPPMTLVFAGNPAIEVQAVATESYLIPYEGYWFPALLGMTPSQDFPLASIMGSPVLRSNVVIFDRAQSRIGFAPHTPCP